MAADKHFDEHGVVPAPLDDRKPDDMPAARWLLVIVLALVLVGAAVTLLLRNAPASEVPHEQGIEQPH